MALIKIHHDLVFHTWSLQGVAEFIGPSTGYSPLMTIDPITFVSSDLGLLSKRQTSNCRPGKASASYCAVKSRYSAASRCMRGPTACQSRGGPSPKRTLIFSSKGGNRISHQQVDSLSFKGCVTRRNSDSGEDSKLLNPKGLLEGKKELAEREGFEPSVQV
jgi:hypothetical protein